MREPELNNKIDDTVIDEMNLPDIPESFSADYMKMINDMLPDSDRLWSRIEAGLDGNVVSFPSGDNTVTTNADSSTAFQNTSQNTVKMRKKQTWKLYYGMIAAAALFFVVGGVAFMSVVRIGGFANSSAPSATAPVFNDSASDAPACEETSEDAMYITDPDDSYKSDNAAGATRGEADLEETYYEQNSEECYTEDCEEDYEESDGEVSYNDDSDESATYDDISEILIFDSVQITRISYNREQVFKRAEAVTEAGDEILLYPDNESDLSVYEALEEGEIYSFVLCIKDEEENGYYIIDFN